MRVRVCALLSLVILMLLVHWVVMVATAEVCWRRWEIGMREDFGDKYCLRCKHRRCTFSNSNTCCIKKRCNFSFAKFIQSCHQGKWVQSFVEALGMHLGASIQTAEIRSYTTKQVSMRAHCEEYVDGVHACENTHVHMAVHAHEHRQVHISQHFSEV